jgi:hypothetical protein
MIWCAASVMFERERLHPRHSGGCGAYLENAADDEAVGQHVVVIIVNAGETKAVLLGWAVAHQAPGRDVFALIVYGRQRAVGPERSWYALLYR